MDKRKALAILNIFDHGVVDLIQGPQIDCPRNAICLTTTMHKFFGSFQIFFDAVPDQPHTYRIDKTSSIPDFFLLDLPIVRPLYLAKHRSIEPPLPRLLALHRAIACILELSAAGEYIDKILRDMEEKVVQTDGSTELGHLVTLGMGGWLDSV